MRVGILTSWRVPCGVYQYSARFADALAQIDGVEPVILAGRADEGRSVPEESAHEVHDFATIGLWRSDGQYGMDYEALPALGLDVIHVQYQGMLFTEPHLIGLHEAYGVHNGVLAVTFHDRCIAPTFPATSFDLRFSHRAEVGVAPEVIPFGIEDRPPIVRTFGLGRTQEEVIRPVCERNGWVFENAASHEPIHGGGQAWRTHEDLISWLRGADAIVLWYPPQPLAGSSQAARTAMAARRLVITNSTEWFSDLPSWVDGDRSPIFRKVDSPEALESALTGAFHRPYVEANSWLRVAERLVERYRSINT